MRFKIKNISIFWQFVLLGVIIFTIIGIFLSSLIAPALIRLTLQQRELTSVVFANRLAAEFLLPEDFVRPAEGESRERFELFANNLQIPGLFRVKIWNPEGIIVYSDIEELIGKRFPLRSELQNAFNLKTEVNLIKFDPNEPQYFYELSFGEGIEAYAPLTFGASPEVMGVVGTYARSGFLQEQINEIKNRFVLSIGLSLALMFAALSFIVWRASRTVDTQRKELSKYATGLEEMVKERTAELEEERTKLSQITQHMKTGVILLDKQGKVVFVNREVKAMLSLKDKGEDKALEMLYAKFPKLNLKELILKCLSGQPSNISEAESDEKIFEILSGCLPEPGKGFFGHLIWIRDITEEKELDRAKTEFVAIASHQLRTPLSTINWYTEMLLSGDRGKITKDQETYLKEIYHGSKRMVDLINSLLNVSRIELGTFSVEPKSVKLIEIADSVIGELFPKIKNKKLKIEKEYDKDLPIMNADPKLMRMVLQNLLANSVNYTPEGGRISLTIKRQGSDVFIKVRDTGYGIPKDQQSKIFDKLFRADNVIEKQTDGTGLGLYTVKAVVEQSGGKIRFESEENKGTTFYVTIPLSGMIKKEGAKRLT
ncbi:MAG: ATP-binding protein [Patescibacteria group bacterium]|nr:ATP-binding protein [Patescibacteria group bacterium]